MIVDSSNSILNSFKEILPLPKAQKLDEKTVNKINSAISEVDNQRKEYEATKEQLKEYPWLKNAVNGIRKVSDIIEDFKNGKDGSGDFTITSNSQDSFTVYDGDERTHYYNIYAQVDYTTTHLAYDDENYTREGQTKVSRIAFHASYYEKSVNEQKELQLNFELEKEKESIDFSKLYERLNTDKDFEKNFMVNIENYLYKNDSSKLIRQLEKGLGLDDSTLKYKDSINTTYLDIFV
ncbi:hypothetical protein [Arcobacter sp. CECT 8985]|uniref:hypothetical protein n=1 Tax=Arcobacter sp. CECT 8985 TaxID=1935424 RepID=UPI00100AE4A8|nr:hypothetical protein [Arcobacter sp. CECT 8985]RXJ86396.1 hypothetical protein CRU93_08910 [Arcobacter sp. CECT 8985]